jgi:hypothetical protein
MRTSIVVVALAALAVGACTTRPIVNVSAEPLGGASGAAVTPEHVRDAILRAGTRLGWQMTPVSTGLVNGRIALRNHVAVIDVTYTSGTYNVRYRDSTNLDYRDGQIHKNYNGWIENLNNAIRMELLRA